MKIERSIHSKRLDAYATRLMPLLSVNDGVKMVDESIVKKVLAIMDWQLEMRKRYDPIDADNQVAKMENRIRRAINTKPMGNRDLKRKCNANRYGLWFYQAALRNLHGEHEICYDKKSQTYRME